MHPTDFPRRFFVTNHEFSFQPAKLSYSASDDLLGRLRVLVHAVRLRA